MGRVGVPRHSMVIYLGREIFTARGVLRASMDGVQSLLPGIDVMKLRVESTFPGAV